jgi:magnesium transporter
MGIVDWCSAKGATLLTAYSIESGTLTPNPAAQDAGTLARAVWIDVWDPTRDEIARIEQIAGIKIRPPERLDRFYVSDQLEATDSQTTLRALLLAGVEQHRPKLLPVTFIRSKGPMVSISKGSPDGLGWLAAECPNCLPASAGDMFSALLDMVVDHATNVLDHVSGDLDQIDRKLFQHHTTAKRRFLILAARERTRQLEAVLTELGYQREVLVKLRRSALSFRRLLGILRERSKDSGLAGKLTEFEHELTAIAEAQVDLSNTAAFMLDGAVGYISILQSKTINIMTVLGILLTPPVLIASIYGMNFKVMPELQWEWGYAWALGLMVLSVIVTFVIVRLRGWL